MVEKNGSLIILLIQKNTHGSGCTLSAAICGYKALGIELLDSIQKAKLFVEKSLLNSYKIGSGPGPLGHN